jgi:hypothetical protein
MGINNITGNFIFDMDEVLVDISPEQYLAIRMNWVKYHRWFKDLGPLTEKQVLERPLFKINEWLLKDEYKKNPKDMEKTLELTHREITKDFFSTDLYSNLVPTPMARKTLMNRMFIDSNRVGKVYILTRYVDEKMLKSKKKFIKRYFNHPKVEMLAVRMDEKKTDIIKKNNIQWNILIDDEIKNIRDFAENLDISGKEFLIPALGYNEMPLVLDILIKEKGAVYNYYKRI